MTEKALIPPINNISIYNITKEHTLTPQGYQIFMVLAGSLHIHWETFDNDYEIRDILIMSPGKNYLISPASDNLVLTLALERHFVHEQLGTSNQIFCDSQEEPGKDYSQIRNIVASIATSYYDNAEGNRLSIYSLLFSLMALLQKSYTVSTINLTDPSENTKHLSRIQEIISYIDENYPQAITLASLAESLYLSPQYLSKFFKQHFHKTFYDYLNQVRIEHALAQIQYTDTSITKIAFNNGFPNLTAFNKIFKDIYATTPSNYRKEFLKSRERGQDSHEEPSGNKTAITATEFANVKAYLSDLSINEKSSSPKETAADINYYMVHANMEDSSPLPNPFIQVINTGFASNMLSSSFQEQLGGALSTVPFKYIRFIGILDAEILPEVSDASEYNFSNVDVILDFLYEHKRIPFLELSNKPRKTTIVTTTTGFLVNPLLEHFFPSDYEHKLEVFLRHCINRYGLSYVSSWYFELWAAHTDYLEFVETPDEYAARFKKIYNILAAHLGHPHLGGPGFNGSAPPHTLGRIVQALLQAKVTPDFISLYLYPYKVTAAPVKSHREEYIFLSSDKDILHKKLQFFIEDLKKYYRQLPPIFITEYNSDLAGKNHINDSCFQATFICRNFLRLKNDVAMMGYWLLGDLAEEYMDFPSTKAGGIGLLNEHGQKKPAFFAYEFLSQLGTAIVCEGENYIVTHKGTNNYAILAFNYAHISKYYCLNHSDKVSVQDTYSIFDTVSPVNMSFQLYNLPAGQYKIKRHILDRDHGSLLDQMARMWFQGNLSFERLSYNIRNLSPGEQEYFSMTCIPSQSIFYKNSDGTLTLNCKVSAHEVVFFEISREF